jgi:hypothetical protein
MDNVSFSADPTVQIDLPYCGRDHPAFQIVKVVANHWETCYSLTDVIIAI